MEWCKLSCVSGVVRGELCKWNRVTGEPGVNEGTGSYQEETVSSNKSTFSLSLSLSLSR